MRGVALTIGIVGLPNVGKSTLFNALTRAEVLAANYPFATIDPNVGVVPLPDSRLGRLAEIFESEKILPATVSFVDIAGIVKGASEGEGLGNKFLANIREADAICQVTRAFSDPDVTRVPGSETPAGDNGRHHDHLPKVLALMLSPQHQLQSDWPRSRRRPPHTLKRNSTTSPSCIT